MTTKPTTADSLFAADGLEVLEEEACRALLEQHDVGRVVIVEGGLAAVFPVNYGVVGTDIVYFTGTGMKLRHATDSSPVTFEVDSIDTSTRTAWSVLVTGTATIASPTLARRAEALGIIPWAAGDRHHAVRIQPDMLTGRRIC